MVLGVGATMTLAAWTDSENATATLTAGTFSLVGSTNGTTFSEHPDAPGASLVFTLSPTALTPGLTVYSLYSVKTAATSVAGTSTLTADAGNSAGLGAYLSYGVTAIAGTTCSSSTYSAGTAIVPTGSALTAGAAAGQAVDEAGASVINYCLAVTLPLTVPNAAQGTSLTARWSFVGTTS
jgi:predicted ribosomally synthesized peptide with SipW-like signal peptide